MQTVKLCMEKLDVWHETCLKKKKEKPASCKVKTKILNMKVFLSSLNSVGVDEAALELIW